MLILEGLDLAEMQASDQVPKLSKAEKEKKKKRKLKGMLIEYFSFLLLSSSNYSIKEEAKSATSSHRREQ